MTHNEGDPLASVNVTRDDLARIGRALRLVEKLSREILNHTPVSAEGVSPPRTAEMASAGQPNGGDAAVWPIEVTGSPDVSLSHPELADLKLGTLYIPDPETDPPWREEQCWIRSVPGITLATGDVGMARLVGWRDADGDTAYDGMPIYALVPGSSAGTDCTHCTDCQGSGWLAGMGLTRCLRVSVNGTATVLYLTTTDGVTWTSVDLLTICTVDYIVTVTRSTSGGLPTLTLTEPGSGGAIHTADWNCAGCSFAKWTFNLQEICPDEPDTGDPCTNVLEVRADANNCASPAGGASCLATTDTTLLPTLVYRGGSTTEFWCMPVVGGETYHAEVTVIAGEAGANLWTSPCSTGIGLTEALWATLGGVSGTFCYDFTPSVDGYMCFGVHNGTVRILSGACP
jgi:hypothetical protein